MGSSDLRSGTREDVTRSIIARGPVTAAQLAVELGITPAAVRRHLDALLDDGRISAVTARPSVSVMRERGRPARAFVATAAAHAAAGSAYDAVATAALEQLRTEAGEAAITRFAGRRAAELEDRYRAAVTAAGPDPRERAKALAGALSGDGYAASTGEVGPSGVQLCQGHCPVHTVAAAFPALCDAETEAFARLVGAPVRRLATLAAGSHACTTHVSTTHVSTTPDHTNRVHTDQISTNQLTAPSRGMAQA